MRECRALDRSYITDSDRPVTAAADEPVISFGEHLGGLRSDAINRLAIWPGLMKLQEIDVLYESDCATLWSFMTHPGRPSFTPQLLHDFEDWQDGILRSFGPGLLDLKFLVLGSRTPGVFCYGGDLDLFQKLIRAGDRNGLVRYGYRCVEILHRNIHALDLPILTVALVQGEALGGGFEALLSFDFIIAEKGSRFGLPEVMFGLFPGMGAHAILSRRVGTAMADRMILRNEIFSAEQLFELGLVHQVCEPGEGVDAVRGFIAREGRRHAGLLGSCRAMRRVSPLPVEELKSVVDIWADSALQLREQDLKLMSKLVAAQVRQSVRTVA